MSKTNKIIELYATGAKITDIAHEVGVTRGYIHALIKRQNMPKMRKRTKPLNAKNLKVLERNTPADDFLLARAKILKAIEIAEAEGKSGAIVYASQALLELTLNYEKSVRQNLALELTNERMKRVLNMSDAQEQLPAIVFNDIPIAETPANDAEPIITHAEH